MKRILVVLAAVTTVGAGCARPPKYDVVVRHGTVFDGTGAPGKIGDVAILGDRIAAVGELGGERSRACINSR